MFLTFSAALSVSAIAGAAIRSNVGADSTRADDGAESKSLSLPPLMRQDRWYFYLIPIAKVDKY